MTAFSKNRLHWVTEKKEKIRVLKYRGAGLSRLSVGHLISAHIVIKPHAGLQKEVLKYS